MHRYVIYQSTAQRTGKFFIDNWNQKAYIIIRKGEQEKSYILPVPANIGKDRLIQSFHADKSKMQIGGRKE